MVRFGVRSCLPRCGQIHDMSRQHAGYAAGLRAGDVLLAVNGEPCATLRPSSRH